MVQINMLAHFIDPIIFKKLVIMVEWERESKTPFV